MWMRDKEVALEEGGDGLVFAAADADTEGISQTCSLQAFDFRAHSCGEEICSSFSWKNFEDFVENWSEIQIEKPVCFVHDKVFERS